MKKLVILLAVLGIAGISSANAIGGLYTFDGIPDQTVAGDGLVYDSGSNVYSQWIPAGGSGTIVSVVGETLSHVGSTGAGWTSSYSYYHDIVAGNTYTLEFDLVSDQSNGIVARFVGAGFFHPDKLLTVFLTPLRNIFQRPVIISQNFQNLS